MTYATDATELGNFGTQFDEIFTDIGEFLNNGSGYDLTDMGMITKMAQRIREVQGVWSLGDTNAATACAASGCLDATGDELTAILTTSANHQDATNVGAFIAALTLEQFEEQRSHIGAAASDDDLEESAYNLVGFDSAMWKLVDWNHAKV